MERIFVGIGLVTVVAIAGACSSSSERPASSSSAAAPAVDAPVYYKDVAPVLQEHCTGCHTQGGIAPFSLTSAADATKHAEAIRAAVQSREMPPWFAGPGCTDYADDLSLSDAQIATLVRWSDTGAPVGDPAQAPPAKARPTEKLSRVDLRTGMAAPYTPKKRPDEWRCFVLDWTPTTTKFVTGIEVKPGQESQVHHLNIYAATPSQVPELERLDAADPDQGYECFGGAGTALPMIGGYAPGGSPVLELPPGLGMEVRPGSKLVVEIHYNTDTHEPLPDQSKFDIALADSITKRVAIVGFTNPDWIQNHTMPIPPRSHDVVHRFTAEPLPLMSRGTEGLIREDEPLTILGVVPHMHTIATKQKISLEHGDGENECLMDMRGWNFHWQRVYRFAQPKIVRPGEKMTLECHWDNPSDQLVNWGNGSNDEMCSLFAFVMQ